MRMCRFRESDLYWVAMKIRRSPELMQLLREARLTSATVAR